MKVVSWNVWNRASDIAAFEKFVRDQDAELYAFQELTDRHIEALEPMAGYSLCLAEDFIEEGQLTYLGIFSRFPISEHLVTKINADRRVSPSWIGRKNTWVECLDAQTVRLETEFGLLDVANVHLSCAVSPGQRRRELQAVLPEAGTQTPFILCGDMNSFAHPLINWLIGWGYGFGWRDIGVNEVAALTSRATDLSMVRVPEKAVTFPGKRLHLDHLFVRGLNIDSCTVEEETFGSDHRPIVCEMVFKGCL